MIGVSWFVQAAQSGGVADQVSGDAFQSALTDLTSVLGDRAVAYLDCPRVRQLSAGVPRLRIIRQLVRMRQMSQP